jgi:hypothetical protein
VLFALEILGAIGIAGVIGVTAGLLMLILQRAAW